MKLSYTARKRPRASFAKRKDTIAMPYLLQMQIDLYDKFLQKDVPNGEREQFGLQKAFTDLFPVESNNGLAEMTFHGYKLEEPMFTVRECKERNLTYSAKIKVHMQLHIRSRDDRTKIKDIRDEENVYMGELPLMTENGSFVINGTERVIVSQLHRAPSVYFMRDQSRQASARKTNFQARFIPNSGSWLDFEFDSKELLYFRVDKRRKMYASLLLRALGYDISEIIREFYDCEEFEIAPKDGESRYKLVPDFLRGVKLPFDIANAGGEVLAKANIRINEGNLKRIQKAGLETLEVSDEFITEGRYTWEDVVDPESGEILAAVNEEVTEALLEEMRAKGVKTLRTIYSNDNDCGMHIANTIRAQENDFKVRDIEHAREMIFRHMRPGDPTTPPEIVSRTFNDAFFNPNRIDLSKVGRMKINQRLGHGIEVRPTKIRAHEHQPRPAMEWCVLAKRNTKQRAMPKFEKLRKAIPAEQMADEEMERVLRELKDDARVVCWHLASEDEAKKLAKKIEAAGLVTEAREQLVLSKHDIVNAIKMLINLVNHKGSTDDIDSLGNRRIRMVGEFIKQEYEAGLRRFQKAVVERMQQADSDNMKPSDLVNAKTIGQSVRDFFNSNQLSQFMDQTNPLAEVTHKRRVSALGVGGLQRDRAGFEVRDVHPTHYGRLCPIETPEGPNIGLINSFSLYSRTNEYGFITTPYRKVVDGKVTDEIAWLSAVEEADSCIAQANSNVSKGSFTDELVTCRKSGEFTFARPEQISYMDVAPSQIASVAASLIPFLEHDDSNRALMGSNMQRQAVPSLRPQKPLVGTGLESKVAADSGHVIKAKQAGVVDYVDASRVVIRTDESKVDEFGVDIYNLTKYMRSNQNTTINQRPTVATGDHVDAGDIIADSSATDNGELALGQNVLVAFMPWNGYNFEDSILVSERLVVDDRFTTVHIEEHVCRARDTRSGPELITRDIPNQPESALAYLDESGIIQIGTEVGPGDILVGKVSPKFQSQPTPDERLLRAIFGNKGEDVKDTSMRMPSNSSGATVVDVKVFTANAEERDERAKSIIRLELEAYRKDLDAKLEIYRQDTDLEREGICLGETAAKAVPGLKANAKITKTWWKKASPEERARVSLKSEKAQKALEALSARFRKMEKSLDADYNRQRHKLERNDDLTTGVNKNIKIYLAIKRQLQVGDKMAGRHGNKGVVSRIVPVEDMPYLEDGTPVDIVLNPLGVPSRMNIGQILETHLGLAARGLGDKIAAVIEGQRSKAAAELRQLLPKIYSRKGMSLPVDFASYDDDEIIETAGRLKDGVPFATPIFDGASEDDIVAMLKLAGLPETAQMKLRDGRTGEEFERPVTVGYKYMFKLHHLVDEKMHARSTGPYSLVTQQPLGGKAQGGGQRLGEMEVWALESYGAAYMLWEMLTVKSDDRIGRNKVYESICKGEVELAPAKPESYKVLQSELRALCIDFEEE